MALQPAGGQKISQTFDIPFIGNQYARIGRVIDLFYTDCHPEPMLWVQGFFQAVPTAFFGIIKPELWDFSKTGHRPRHGKGRTGSFHAIWKFTDSIVEIPLPNWKAFSVFEMVERIGWWFIIADTTTEGAINWMSLAYEMQGCPAAHDAYGVYTNQNNRAYVTDGDGSLMVWNVIHAKNMSSTPTCKRILALPPWRISLNIEAFPHPTFTPVGRLQVARIIDCTGGELVLPVESHLIPGGGYKSTASGTWTGGGGFSPPFGVALSGQEGFVQLTPGSRFNLGVFKGRDLRWDP